MLGLARLRSEDVPRKLFRSDDADSARLERPCADFGSDDNDALLVVDQAS